MSSHGRYNQLFAQKEAKPGVGRAVGPRKPAKRKVSTRERSLSTLHEDNVFHDGHRGNRVKAQPRQGRWSTRSSLTDITNAPSGICEGDEDVFATACDLPKIKSQLRVAAKGRSPGICSILACPTFDDEALVGGSLPKGVHCIDVSDGSDLSYSDDNVRHAKFQELAREWTGKWRGFLSASRLRRTRSLLIDWLLEVLHYFNSSQEALYQTVSIVDRFMSRRKVDSDRIQLVGIASLLIATKLEEYYAADLEELSKLSRGSCEVNDILKMEIEILVAINFKAYSVDPMVFVNRFLRAAQRDGDMFLEASIFFMDATLCWEDYWSICPSKKAAAAVFAALNLIPENGDDDSVVWTPTLEHYTEYSVGQIALLSRQMLDLMLKVVEGESNIDACGLKNKYTSTSRHHGFLRSDNCKAANIELVIQRINRF